MPDERRPRSADQVAATLVDGQAVIVMADSGQMTVLNEVGSHIWELCDGTRSVEDIIDVIQAEYDINLQEAQQDVIEFVDRLASIGALVF